VKRRHYKVKRKSGESIIKGNLQKQGEAAWKKGLYTITLRELNIPVLGAFILE